MVITSPIAQTAKSRDSPEKFAEVIEGRMQALSRVHNLLNQNQWDRAALRDVIAGELAPYRNGNEENIVFDGKPDVALTPKATQTLAMVFHELATNAGVLLVEDQMIVAMQIEDMLRAAGEIVGPVGTLQAAIALVREKAFDLAVVDQPRRQERFSGGGGTAGTGHPVHFRDWLR